MCCTLLLVLRRWVGVGVGVGWRRERRTCDDVDGLFLSVLSSFAAVSMPRKDVDGFVFARGGKRKELSIPYHTIPTQLKGKGKLDGSFGLLVIRSTTDEGSFRSISLRNRTLYK